MSLENPQNRDELIEHCKMRIGEPMFKINITQMQARLRVKEAVRKFLDYHFDATERAWIKQEITPAIASNKFITVPEFVVGVDKILNMKPNMFRDVNMIGSSIFSILNRNLLQNVETSNKVDVYLYNREVSEWEEIWRPTPHYDFNRTTKVLKIDTSGSNLIVGDFIMYRAAVDISFSNGDFFSNDWLIRYTSCLIKEQWGENLSKFKDIQLPGGHSYSADDIASKAAEEKVKLLEELHEEASYIYSPILIG